MRDHEHRGAIREEVHARPVVMVPEPARLRRLVFLPGPGDPGVGAIQAMLASWCGRMGLDVPEPHVRQHSFARRGTEGCSVTFEFHNEFVTLTWSSSPGEAEAFPKDIGLELVADLPLVAAVVIDLLAEAALPAAALSHFNPASLCHVGIEGGAAQIATDLVEDGDGFVRFFLAGRNLTPLRRSIIARRLLEVETYSKLTLLGLPPVRAAGGELTALEAEISQILARLPEIDEVGEAQDAIKGLNGLAQRVAVVNDRLNYRVAASQAYGQIVSDRLRVLHDEATGNGSNISAYVDNRVGPALRTLAATEKRLLNAGRRIERAAMMLNARNGLELEMQNSTILKTISRTARSQYRLQRTVEGLSVIAITYYLVGILGYALSGPIHALGWDKEWVMAAVTPLALVAVFVASRFLWRGHKE
ncbi:MAG: DUF3422 domain-containing protein [Alphaproteobacteria bacterium]|nr:DUF3422 domain-containing protein [Alphaproteobacteria bacterium]